PHAPALEPAQRTLQALSLFAEPALRRRRAIVQRNLRRTRRPQAHLVFIARNLESRKTRLDEKCRNSLPVRFRICLREHDVYARLPAVRHPSLCAVQPIPTAVASILEHGPPLNRRRIGACLTLRQTKRA